MVLELISQPPSPSSFTPLSSHQAQTPQSFFGGKPVLHYEDENARIVCSRDQLGRFPLFGRPRQQQQQQQQQEAGEGAEGDNGGANGHVSNDGEDEEGDAVVSGVHVWVTSERLVLYNPAQSSGLAISYPSILLHAIQRLRLSEAPASAAQEQGLYMQISAPAAATASDDARNDDDDDDLLSITIIPSAPPPRPPSEHVAEEVQMSQSAGGGSTAAVSTADPPTQTTTTTPPTPSAPPQIQSPIQVLFAAILTCSNLHPDPTTIASSDDDDDDQVVDGGVSDADDPIVFEGSVGYESGLLVRRPGGDDRSGSGGLPPPPFPGSGGWITAENVGEFFDDEGNPREGAFQGRRLGPGRGVVRGRDSGGGGGGDGENGREEEDFMGEETKWRRTG